MATATNTTARPEILEQLTEGIAQLCSSDAWRTWLDTARRFHRYSFNNQLLIALQSRGEATQVAGFHAWLSLGRHVRKGEKGLRILAPITRKRQVESEDGNEAEATRTLVGFKAAHVFDISQTDGDPLPEGPCKRLTGDDPSDSFERLEHVALMLGFSVDVEPLRGERNGETTFLDRAIRIREGLAPAQMVKTLCHELGHALMHENFLGNRQLAECEAESVAYCLCADLGLDTSEYSLGYVASWAGGGDEAIKAITASAGRIQLAVKTLLDALDGMTVAA